MKPFEIRPATTTTKQSPGFCILCGAPATKIALFQLKDAQVIQRYCDACLPKAKYDESDR